MKPYFSKIPLVPYDVAGTGEKRAAVNILQRAKIRDILKDKTLIFYPYTIQDGETPELIAFKLYGNTLFHELVLMANDIHDVNNDWPLSSDNLIETMRKKYGTKLRDGVELAMGAHHHYEDKHGNVIDKETFLTTPAVERRDVTVYEWEIAQNEKKRRIVLLDKQYAERIDAELDKIMQRPLR